MNDDPEHPESKEEAPSSASADEASSPFEVSSAPPARPEEASEERAGRPPIEVSPGAPAPLASGRSRPALSESQEPLYREAGGFRLRLEPADLVRLRELPGAKGRTDKELGEEFFGFPAYVIEREQSLGVRTFDARHGHHEFQDRLMRYANAVLEDAFAKEVSSDALLLREACIEAIDQDVGINQCCHQRYRVLVASSRDPVRLEGSVSSVVAPVARWPRRKAVHDQLDLIDAQA